MGPAEDQGMWRKTPTSRALMSVASSHRASRQMGAHGHSTAGCRDGKLVRGVAALAPPCAEAAGGGGGGGGSEGAHMFMPSNEQQVTSNEQPRWTKAPPPPPPPCSGRACLSDCDLAGQCNPLRAFRNGHGLRDCVRNTLHRQPCTFEPPAAIVAVVVVVHEHGVLVAPSDVTSPS